MNTTSLRYLVRLAALSVLAACASTPQPVARLASAEAAIRAADESGARQVPNAALHLHYAELQRGQAQRLMKEGEHERAAMKFQRAEADANLAVALARESRATSAANAATQALNDGGSANNKLISNPSERRQ